MRRAAFSQSACSLFPAARAVWCGPARAFRAQPGVSRATRHRGAPYAAAGAAPVFRFRLASDRPAFRTFRRIATGLRLEHPREVERRRGVSEFQADVFLRFGVFFRPAILPVFNAVAPRLGARPLRQPPRPQRRATRMSPSKARAAVPALRITKPTVRVGFEADFPSQFWNRPSESVSCLAGSEPVS